MKNTYYFITLIIISLIISGLQLFSGSFSLRAMSLHMIFHAMFFIGLFIEEIFPRMTIKGIKSYIIPFIVLCIFTVFQLFEYLHHDHTTVVENNFGFISTTIIVLLLLFQYRILHATKLCSTLCHITKFHTLSDVAVIMVAVLAPKILSNQKLVTELDYFLGVIILLVIWAIFIGRFFTTLDSQAIQEKNTEPKPTG